MAINVIGTLEGPLGETLPDTSIRVHSIYNKDGMSYLKSEITTDSSGNYDFNLDAGKYKIEIKQKNKYNYGAYILVDSETVSPITLEELVKEYSFCIGEDLELHFVQDTIPDTSKGTQGSTWFKGDTGQKFVLYGDSTNDLVWVETYFIKGDEIDE